MSVKSADALCPPVGVKWKFGEAMSAQWLVTLSTVLLDLDSNSGDGKDVCKCTVPSRHGGTLNSRRVASEVGGRE
ncbi:hypothetical protein TNCV_4990621 [Trichonephila clavipes]|nr:hypothetical protein TNCV_4990621 [Trichonephila clavipes]